MRDSSDFIRELRAEINASQTRRNGFVQAKLTFLVGLLGVGNLTIGNASQTSLLLYLVPIVAFIFDLYIMGEDFSIKRAGIFIAKSPYSPAEEHLWEEGVSRWKDPFVILATPLSSLVVLLAAAIGIWLSGERAIPFWLWVSGTLALIAIVVGNRWLRQRNLRSFKTFLQESATHRALFKPEGEQPGPPL